MAPMITDSYLKYSNSDFGTNKSINGLGSPAQGPGAANPRYAMQTNNDGPSQSKLNDASINGFKLDSLQKSLLENTRRRYTAEENISDILKGNDNNSFKKQNFFNAL